MNYEKYCQNLRDLGVEEKEITKLSRNLIFFIISISIFMGVLVDSLVGKFGGIAGVFTVIALTFTIFSYASADIESYYSVKKLTKLGVLFSILLILGSIALKIFI